MGVGTPSKLEWTFCTQNLLGQADRQIFQVKGSVKSCYWFCEVFFTL